MNTRTRKLAAVVALALAIPACRGLGSPDANTSVPAAAPPTTDSGINSGGESPTPDPGKPPGVDGNQPPPSGKPGDGSQPGAEVSQEGEENPSLPPVTAEVDVTGYFGVSFLRVCEEDPCPEEGVRRQRSGPLAVRITLLPPSRAQRLVTEVLNEGAERVRRLEVTYDMDFTYLKICDGTGGGEGDCRQPSAVEEVIASVSPTCHIEPFGATAARVRCSPGGLDSGAQTAVQADFRRDVPLHGSVENTVTVIGEL